MALPDLKLPGGLPYFLASGHAIEVREVFGNSTPTTGHSRKRRKFTIAPRVQSVSLLLEGHEMKVLHDWFERDAAAGSRPFSAFVMTEGGAPMWWEAMWFEPYTTSALARGRFRLNGRLLLTGEPSLDGPGRSSFGSRVSVPATGAAMPSVGRPFSGRVSVAAFGSVPVQHDRRLAGRITIEAT